MPGTKLTNAGFAASVIIAAVAVIAILGGFSYVLLNRNSGESFKQAAITPTTAPSKNEGIKQPDSRPAESATTTIEIRELGIRLTVPNSIKDLTYKADEATLPNGDVAKRAFFSTQSLTRTNPKCSPENGALGAIQRVKGKYPDDKEDAYFNYGPLLKQYPNEFLTFVTSKADCTGSSDAQVLEAYSKASNDFQASTIRAELTE